MNTNLYPVWVEINRSTLLNNVIQLKKNLKKYNSDAKFCGVIKSNAYGHGMVIAGKIIEKEVDYFAVNALWEAIQLTDELKTSKPIIVLGYTPMSALENLVKYPNIRIIVYNIETLEKLAELADRYNVKIHTHIKVETGTGRQGILFSEINKFADFFIKNKNVILEGISTHFANIEDTTSHTYYKYQLSNFKNFLTGFSSAGIEIPVRHTACTAACMLFSDTYFNLIRPGIGLYGLWPSRETYLSCLMQGKYALKLEPALSFKTRMAQIKELPSDSYIGYGCSFKTTQPTKIAVLPVGYFDGYDRALSNKSYVIIRNHRAPIVGRVCMNISMADITHIPDAVIEDEVILLGKSANEEISADTMAGMIGTINYEVVTRINPVLPRIVI